MAEQVNGPVLKTLRTRGPVEIICKTIEWQVNKNTERLAKVDEVLNAVDQVALARMH